MRGIINKIDFMLEGSRPKKEKPAINTDAVKLQNIDNLLKMRKDLCSVFEKEYSKIQKHMQPGSGNFFQFMGDEYERHQISREAAVAVLEKHLKVKFSMRGYRDQAVLKILDICFED